MTPSPKPAPVLKPTSFRVLKATTARRVRRYVSKGRRRVETLH